MEKYPDLHNLISDLPFTEAFKLTAEQLDLKTIADILEHDSAAFSKLPGFNYHFLQEFISYVENNGMADLLKE